jgi:hypothetical protein
MTIASSTQLICFTVLSAVVAIGALGVVLLPNIVYSAFLLGGVFLSVAGLYLLLNASFVAAAQVLVYVGAVNVLILFAIMLVNKKEDLAAIPGLAGGPWQVASSQPLQPARGAALDRDRLEQQLGRLGGTPWCLGGLEVCLEGEMFLPVAQLNELRRALVDQLVKGVLAVGAGFAPNDGPGGVVDAVAVAVHGLAVGLHVLLLQKSDQLAQRRVIRCHMVGAGA